MPAAGQFQFSTTWLLSWTEWQDLAQEKGQLEIALLLSGHTMYPSHHEQPGRTASNRRPSHKSRRYKFLYPPQSISLPLPRPPKPPTQLQLRARCRGAEGDEWDGVGVVQMLRLSSCWMKVTRCCEIKIGASWSRGGGSFWSMWIIMGNE